MLVIYLSFLFFNMQTSSLLIAEKDYENLSLSSYTDDVDIPEGFAPTPFSHQDIEQLLKIASDDTSSSKSGDTTQTGPPSYRSVMKKGSRSASCGSHATNQSQTNSEMVDQSQGSNQTADQSQTDTRVSTQSQFTSESVGQSHANTLPTMTAAAHSTELDLIEDKSECVMRGLASKIEADQTRNQKSVVFLKAFDNQLYSETLC